MNTRMTLCQLEMFRNKLTEEGIFRQLPDAIPKTIPCEKFQQRLASVR
ncbi:hypothetical protein [uncultured Desulfovibrio sp.]|nr:hypothetical protein [uncultured Desulfovibrio sp.]